MNNYPPYDSAAALREARERMPLEQVLEQHGHAPRNRKWNCFMCPFCRKKGKAGVFWSADGTTQLFKCQSTSCETGARAMDAVGYIQFLRGCTRADAFETYLRMAGVWQERTRLAPPITAEPEGPPPPPAEPGPATHENASPGNSNPTEHATAVSGEALPLGQEQEAARVANESPALDRFFGGGGTSSRGSRGEVSQSECLAVLREFFGQLTLNQKDIDHLYYERSIQSDDSQALGFRSNTRANMEILTALRRTAPFTGLLETGLWIKRGQRSLPNNQFFGWGRTGGKDEKGEAVWDWVEPILIPYLDEAGEVCHLRPHKGGVKGKAAHLYVPRRLGVAAEERFETVLITEGEFKAAALMARLPEGFGVCALPGVQMANNYAMRQELMLWLGNVRARRVIVVYDNEEKGDPKLPGYKADFTKRYDATVWGGLLAMSLWKELKIRTQFALLPKELRDEKGKVDWDGSMALRQNRKLAEMGVQQARSASEATAE